MADIPTVVLSAGGGGGGASTSDAFVTIGHPADLTAERNLAVGASLALADGGANSDVILTRAALTGDVTAAADSNATTIAAGAVTYAKMQATSGASVLLGRGSGAGPFVVQEITLGANLSLAGTVLSAATGSGANGVEATVDFGTAGDYATVTVTGQAWVTATSKIVASLFGNTVDHDEEDALLEELTTLVTNRVVGTGFDVHVHAPFGTFGTYKVHCLGVAA